MLWYISTDRMPPGSLNQGWPNHSWLTTCSSFTVKMQLMSPHPPHILCLPDYRGSLGLLQSGGTRGLCQRQLVPAENGEYNLKVQAPAPNPGKHAPALELLKIVICGSKSLATPGLDGAKSGKFKRLQCLQMNYSVAMSTLAW